MRAYKSLKIPHTREERAYLRVIFVFSTFFFTFAYIASIIDYVINQKAALLWGNVVSIILIWAIYLLFRGGKLNLNNSLLVHVAVIAINLYYGMLHEAFMEANGSILHVVECMCVCMVPSVLAGMTNWRWLPIIVAIGAIVCYIIAGIGMGNPENMLTHVPAFAIVIIGLGFTFSYLLKLNRAVEDENIQVKIEQQNIASMLDLTPKQWELIRHGRMSRQRMEKLLSELYGATREKMLYQMKNTMHSDEQIKNAIRARHPNLPPGDMELCALIVQQKSVTEIANLQGVKTHSVTARRSRLRKKLGFSPEQNLNDYLQGIARTYISDEGVLT